jgi:hypothetical protein
MRNTGRTQHDAHVRARVLHYIRLRCRITDEHCWLWSMAVSKSGQPVIGGKIIGGRSVAYAHRIAYMAEGRQLRKGHVLVSTCGNAECCNPAHRAQLSRAQWQRTPERQASLSRGVQHSVAVVPARRAGANVRLSLEIARQIRRRYAEVANYTAVAREFSAAGITLRASDVHRIVRNEYWREPSPWHFGHAAAQAP